VILSDLHIDKNTHGRMKNHEYIRVQDGIDSLYDVTEYCSENNVEQLICTGDQFDNSYVQPRYRKLFYNWLTSITDLNIEIVLLMGNHDLNNNKTADHAMMDLVLLNPPNISVIENPELIEFDDFSLACIPWNKYNEIPEFDLHRYTISVAHCSTFKNQPAWENSDADYQIPLEYFTDNFDISILGHIHPYDVLNKSPLVAYAGSLQRSSFGNSHSMGFYHITDNGYEHIKYALRPREVLTELPNKINSETIYRFIYEDEQYTSTEIDNAFRGAFSLNVKHIRTQSTRNTRFDGDPNEMSHDEIFKQYCKTEGLDYKDLEETWLQISQE